MKSRAWKRWLVIAVVGGTVGGLGGCGEKETPAAKPPNIIVIMGNDLDVTAANLALTQTRAQIGDQGARFTSFFTSRSLATSARVTFLTGQYSHNHGILTNSLPAGGFEAFYARGMESSTLATTLQSAGYSTALLGRYLTGYPQGVAASYIPPGWSEWTAIENPSEQDANRYFNYLLNDNGRMVSKGGAAEDYSTDVLARRAVEVIRQVGNDQPLFMWIAPFACRNPADAAPRHEGRFGDATAPRVPSSNESDVSDKPAWIRARSPLSAADVASQDEIARGRLRTLLAMDEMVVSVLDALQSTGKLANTYIFVTSDHGYRMGGEHRIRHGKQTAYEEDIRVPFMVRGPQVAPGRVIDHICLENDVAPTILELAGLPAPSSVDGRSLVPLFGSGAPAASAWRRSFLIQHWTSTQDQGIPAWRALRSSNYLYVEWPASSFSSTLEREVYDLRSDPYELQSLHGSLDAATLSRMADKLNELGRCAGASCRSAEDAALSF